MAGLTDTVSPPWMVPIDVEAAISPRGDVSLSAANFSAVLDAMHFRPSPPIRSTVLRSVFTPSHIRMTGLMPVLLGEPGVCDTTPDDAVKV